MAKCIVELERIYGIKHGNNQSTGNNFASSKTQSDIAICCECGTGSLVCTYSDVWIR